jgi:polyisoprenoid-binding protein YceI
MKQFILPLVSGIFFLSSAFYVVKSAPDYSFKEGYKIGFKSKDPSGEFTKMSGTVKFDESDLANSKFDLSFDVNSISTGNGMKNKKAMTAEWFEASKYPTIKYVSSKIEKSGSDYLVKGKLTIKGTTKEVDVPLKVSKSGNDLSFSGDFKVNRIDFKVGKKSGAVPDFMNISYSIPVKKK